MGGGRVEGDESVAGRFQFLIIPFAIWLGIDYRDT